MTPDRPGLAGIYIGSGISQKTEEPFCHVTCQSTDGVFCEGQLTPQEVRQTALDWLEAAEAAIHDAAVYKLLRSTGMEAKMAAHFISTLREHRQDVDKMVDIPEE